MKKLILFLLSSVFIISLVSASENYEFNLPSNQLWYDTKINLEPGQVIYSKYSGSFLSTGPDQDPNNLACPSKQKHVLVAKVGDGGCFEFTGYTEVKWSGNLFISLNDYTDSYSDNEGSWMVSLYIADKEDSQADSASSTKQEYKSYEEKEKEEYYKAYEYSEEELKKLEEEFEDYFKKAFGDGLNSEGKIKVKWSAKFGDEVKEFESEEEFEKYHKEYFGFGAKESMAIPFEFKWNADSKESKDEEEDEEECKNGCLFNDKCLPMGLRLSTENPVFCSPEGSIKLQKQTSESCDNNFECLTNQCSNQKCVDLQKELEETRKEVKETKGLLQSFWDWLRGIFSFGD